MGGARILAVWGQRGDRAKGIGGKTGHVPRASSYMGPVWGAAGRQDQGHGGSSRPLYSPLAPPMYQVWIHATDLPKPD